MQDHLQAIITVLTLINPLMCAAIFEGIEIRPAARPADGRCLQGRACRTGDPHTGRSVRPAAIGRVRRVVGRVYGGGRLGAGLDRVRNAARGREPIPSHPAAGRQVGIGRSRR